MSSDTHVSPDGPIRSQVGDQTFTQANAGSTSVPNQSASGTEHAPDAIEGLSSVDNASSNGAKDDVTITVNTDPLDLRKHLRDDVTQKQLKADYPLAKPRHMKKFYTRQNALIDQFLQSGDEERLAALDQLENGPKVRFAVNASFVVNFCLFVIQMYAAISTGSLSLFATAADAFMDLVSSVVMLITSRMAARPSVYKYPVGRTRIETIGIIMFCCLMTTVAIQLIIESGRALGAGAKEHEQLHIIPIAFVATAIFCKGSLCIYCFIFRRYPAVHVFFIDHRNDIVVNAFGLAMSIVGSRVVWYLDPIGAILIGVLILTSWAANAFDHVWLLVGKSAPQEFISKLIYLVVTHDTRIQKVDTCRAYHAGQNYYVEVDIVMDEGQPLKVTHDVAQTLQRKLEGLADVERAYVHVDYEDVHDIYEEHKPLYEVTQSRTIKERVKNLRYIFKGKKQAEA
ncbi:Cation efflux family protein [Pyrenophora tritici-repentis]|uniref:Cation efflux family protein n=1 Tax=Pyrenophora tritici-repentis TaxID=45151 RepID=A0A2W1G8W9_9PLEO|nr:Cation efflux family protein [Pyrenophora tritici-repentis]KAF7448034.1 Cation efflux family protein [Pyrenophora tritici-repentis]KAF7571739.1 MMT1, Co/Zn/Cd cation transporter [Pyrenophora tritici-repentis]KAG9385051.1 Cation efflux family protein [Pyrenophora tritici-repentis]KAI0575700.1 Cation efflux family protein [Pyrenophora tritici-repentis]